MSTYNKSVLVSGSNYGHFHCSWEISNFSLLDSTVGKYFQSDSFLMQAYSTRWRLCIYPGGVKDDYKGFVSCFLVLSTRQRDEIYMQILAMSFRNSAGKILWQSKPNAWTTLENGMDWGYRKSKQRDALISELTDDVLVVSASVAYCCTYVKSHEDMDISAEMSSSAKLAQDYELLSKNEGTTDIVICCKNEKIPAHSVVLCARSKVFAAMLENDMEEKKSNRIEITDFDGQTIDFLIRFMYTGIVEVLNIDIALELLRAADKYDVDDLKLYCSNYLIPEINDDTVVQFAIKADMFNCKKLRSRAIEYLVVKDRREIIKEHRSLLKDRPELLLDFLEAYDD